MQTAQDTQTMTAETPEPRDDRETDGDADRGRSGKDASGREVILSVKDLTVAFGSNVVLDALNLDIYRGEILGFVGPSGTGKSVLMRTVLRLLPRRSGKIEILGAEYDAVSEEERVELDTRLGVLFQHGALFSSLTVKENIQVPMREYLDLPQEIMDDLARLKIELVGLAPEAADKFPSELSGGMIKRAALARALALDPDLVFLDEPTSGLDPIGAAEFDELIARLRDTLGLTVYMVTHDLDSLFSVCDRIAVLGKKKVMVEGTIEDMLASDDDWVQSYFRGKRARSIVRDDGHDLHHHDAAVAERNAADRQENPQSSPQGTRAG
ncbi:ABC transporter ATP-binding protein [Rhizobium sp. Leaf341]|uniref:ABC transporter ATP-binding protein n=1 Tax=Rhizobium sp. Leaf341 TaxID=1736344 RepID=UPI000B1EEEE3|nr:ABC transporter ATP-binding protein [Rhizobium sp. Leaf341]